MGCIAQLLVCDMDRFLRTNLACLWFLRYLFLLFGFFLNFFDFFLLFLIVRLVILFDSIS